MLRSVMPTGPPLFCRMTRVAHCSRPVAPRVGFIPVSRHRLLRSAGSFRASRFVFALPQYYRRGSVAASSEEADMSVLDDYLVDPRLSLLDKTRIQAQVLVPVLEALRSELGKEKADAIVRQALRGWSKELFAGIGEGVDGSPRRKWAAMHTAMAEATEQDVAVEMRRHDKEALDFDVTHCRFAEFFRTLGEPELGALLVCETDFDIAAAAAGDVTLTRDQTIMKGAPSCTFRYKFAPRP